MTSSRGRCLLGIVACCLVGCADFSRGSPSPDAAREAGVSAADGGTVGDAALSFAADVHGILLTSCKACHAQGKEAGGTQFLLTGDAPADFSSVSRLVDTGAPTSSRLLTKMSGHGHGGGLLFSNDSPEYQLVLRWIQEGAPP